MQKIRTVSRTIGLVVVTTIVFGSLTSCWPLVPNGPSRSEPSSRDRLVFEIRQRLVDSHQFEAVEVVKGNLTVGWDLDVTVSTETSLNSAQLDLMLRTVGERVADTNIANVTFRNCSPHSVICDSLHVAARGLGLVDKLTQYGHSLSLWRDEVVNYAKKATRSNSPLVNTIHLKKFFGVSYPTRPTNAEVAQLRFHKTSTR